MKAQAHASVALALLVGAGAVLSAADLVNWGKSVRYDSGRLPSVKLDGKGNVVEVHISQSNDQLWCRVGKADFASKSVSWQERGIERPLAP